MHKVFDVAVIGGGHAGIEAAWLAAKAGAKVVLITMDANKIGAMHCNPSIGGLGKGHLVFEISALGGLMPQLCTKTHLQARMLNTSKGPAVQGLRLQIDRKAYLALAGKMLQQCENLTILEDEAEAIVTQVVDGKKQVTGIKTASGIQISVNAVVVATGTFLRSRIFIGNEEQDCGKILSPSSMKLSASLEEAIEFKLGRLRTGTPPRLLKSSLDYSKFKLQPAHSLDYLFEFTPTTSVTREDCFLTHTTAKSKEIITGNLANSVIFSGDMPSVGPRYCPSIELKFVRFPDKETHHIFVEPEELDGELMYPAGLSSGMPREVQEELIHSVPGFENAVIVRPGFQIEYDFLQPTGLDNTLQSKRVQGLFLAGQINGTTGYEEAAAQGALAGINAALLALNRPPLVLHRWESYIGVMVEDLITLGVDEPYRMFTSRAERRLSLRQDNVFARLMPKAREVGLIDDKLWQEFLAEEELVAKAWEWISYERMKQNSVFRKLNVFSISDETKAEIQQLLAERLCIDAQSATAKISGRVLARLHAQVRYDGYLEREKIEAERFCKYSKIKIPQDFDYYCLEGLRKELKDKLFHTKPETIGQAMQIPGMTPAAISILVIMLQRKNRVAVVGSAD